jgi:hypothetical protein
MDEYTYIVDNGTTYGTDVITCMCVLCLRFSLSLGNGEVDVDLQHSTCILFHSHFKIKRDILTKSSPQLEALKSELQIS